MRKIIFSNKIRLLFIPFILLFIQACDNPSTVKIPDENSREGKIAAIDKLCDSVLKAYPEMTAIIIGAWDAPKGFTLTKAYGFTDNSKKIPAVPNMLSRIASITKTFTSTIALQLVDQGKLSLDDKISKYFPEYDKYKAITIRMLCDMTSGISDYSLDPAFQNQMLQNASKAIAPAEIITFMHSKTKLLFTPGTQHAYSSTNTILLGMIIEKISAEKIEEMVNNRFIKPLNLKNTYFPTGIKMPAPNFIHGYYYGLDVSELFDVSYAWVAGGMLSNIFDMKIWIEKVIKGDLLSTSIQEQRFIGLKNKDSQIYGLGIYNPVENIWGHAGTVPGYESIAATDKTKDRTFVVFFNKMDDNISPEFIVKRMIQIINK